MFLRHFVILTLKMQLRLFHIEKCQPICKGIDKFLYRDEPLTFYNGSQGEVSLSFYED